VILLSLVTVVAGIHLTNRSLLPGAAVPTQGRAGQGERNVPSVAPGGQPEPAVPIGPLAKETTPEFGHVESDRPADIALHKHSPEHRSRPLTTQEIVARSEASVALIKGHVGSGTGFLIREGLLATNAHVIADEPVRSLQVHFPSAPFESRGPFAARLLYQDSGRDLALLNLGCRLPPLELSRSHIFKRGENVTIIGSPGLTADVTLPNAVSRGVMSTEVQLEGHRFYQLGAAVNAGNSGGPAFNDLGEVIGVVTAKATRQESIGFCIPVEDLISALTSAAAASPEQLSRARTLHDTTAVVRRLQSAGEVSSRAIDAYIAAVDQAVQQGGSPQIAVRDARQVMQGRLASVNRQLTEDLGPAIEALVADPELAGGIRRDLRSLWGAFSKLRDCAENPQGAVAGFLSSARVSKARFNDGLQRLKLALGGDFDD